jgi:phage protein D
VLSEVEVRGHNPRDPGSPIIGRATAGSELSQESGKKPASQACPTVSKRIITNVIVTSVNHANAIAKSALNNASASFIEGTVESIGIQQIKPGVNIKLEKMGKRFSGKYYVLETTHTINDNGYKTSFKVSRNAV